MKFEKKIVYIKNVRTVPNSDRNIIETKANTFPDLVQNKLVL